MQVAETFTAEFSSAMLEAEGQMDGMDVDKDNGLQMQLDEDDKKVLEEMYAPSDPQAQIHYSYTNIDVEQKWAACTRSPNSTQPSP